ncbi:MAG TPA: hypothetical protein VGB75_13550 [Jatrophihabitans sp.]|jgi:hypothetical protein|uniref:SCO4848 family membrane protein n=1 Tax=Jatrophihabitans sp. TaxID=1932789 RepID=UPI002EF87399
MRLSRRVSGLLIGFGVWSWIIWPTFLKNVWQDERSWQDGPTGFFLVHLALTVVSLALGAAIGWLGVRGWQAARRPVTEAAGRPDSSRTSR